jgi:hypothetical protein
MQCNGMNVDVQNMHTSLYLVFRCWHATSCIVACIGSRTGRAASSSLRTCAYSLAEDFTLDDATKRAFAEAISANQHSALINLQGVDLSLFADVLDVSDGFRNNSAILAHVKAQRIARQRVKSARGGTK